LVVLRGEPTLTARPRESGSAAVARIHKIEEEVDV